MNILIEALPHIQGLIPNQNITIVKQEIVNVDGYPETVEAETKTNAQIQPLTPFELKKLGVADIGANSYFRFWILDNLVEVLSYLNNINTQIKWGDREFNIYSKSDWSLNGWIEVIGSEFKDV